MNQEQQKQKAAHAALQYVEGGMTLGVGTGSTTNYFIDYLAESKIPIDACVASSLATEKRLKAHGFEVIALTSASTIQLYVDGADECTIQGNLIKGGGGALTREKIIAASSECFVCIADISKKVSVLGHFPVAIEVIPMARSLVGRHLVKLGGAPVYREGFVTDNGNIILDVHHLDLSDPVRMEEMLNNIPGVVCHGIFAHRKADIILLGTEQSVEIISV